MNRLRALFATPRRAALSIVAIVILLLVALYLAFADLGAPDDSDMRIVRRQPAPEDNGYFEIADLPEAPEDAAQFSDVFWVSFRGDVDSVKEWGGVGPGSRRRDSVRERRGLRADRSVLGCSGLRLSGGELVERFVADAVSLDPGASRTALGVARGVASAQARHRRGC